jgi:hypothetical protein
MARIRSALFVCVALFFAPLAIAHHAILAKFDNDRPVTLTGVVTKISWANPHVHIFVNVTSRGGSVANWAVELQSPAVLENSGWKADTLGPGDSVWVAGIAARDGSDQAWGFTVVRSDNGKRLFAIDQDARKKGLSGRPGGPTPRWPDGQPRLGPPPGQTGYWTAPSRATLVQDGVNVETDAHGLLRHIEDAARVAPFQSWAKDLYVLRQRTFLKDDPLYLYCIPPGGPRQFQMPFPYGVQFVEDRARGRIFILMGGGNSNWRLIHTRPAARGGASAGDASKQLFYGRSDARWDGDTLVIHARGFNDTFWFSNGGLPHTDQLTLTEHISRPDLDTLRYSVTVDDPGAYTRPWTSSWTLQWLPGKELPSYYCQDNRP